jgi:hypothetical protein
MAEIETETETLTITCRFNLAQIEQVEFLFN